MCMGSSQDGTAGGSALSFSPETPKSAALAAIDQNMAPGNPVVSPAASSPATQAYDSTQDEAAIRADIEASKAQLRASREKMPDLATKALAAGADPARVDQMMREAGMGQDRWVFTDGKPAPANTRGLAIDETPAAKQDAAPTGEPAPGMATPKPRPEPPSSESYTVRKGDTLSAIAKRFYGNDSPASIRKLQKANGIKNANRIAIGQVLKVDVPARDKAPAPIPRAEPAPQPSDDINNLKSQLADAQLNVLSLTTRALANGVDPKVVEDQLKKSGIDRRLWPRLK